MRNYYIAAEACGEKSRCKGTTIGANSKNVLFQIHEFGTERVEIERFRGGAGYASTSFLAIFWYTEGERPTIFLKTLMNVVGDLKPTLSAMPLTVRLP